MTARWRQPVSDPRFDLDDDGDVDVVDVMLVARRWNETGPTPPRLPGAGLAWAEGSARKVRLTDRPPASTWVWDGCRIRLHAARGETAPVQLVVTAGSQALTGVDVTASALTDGLGGAIGADQVRLYRQAYFDVSQPSDPYGYGLPAAVLAPGLIPDALIPFDDPYNPGPAVGAPFDVPAGQNQPIWIDVAVPAGTPAGAYQGTLAVTTDQGNLSVPLTLVVWSFALPDRPSLFISFPMDPAWTLPPQYGVAEGSPAYFELIDKHYAMLAAHRLGPMNLYREPAVSEPGGQVQLDWSQAEPLYSHWLDTRDLIGFYVPDVFDGAADRYRIRKAGGGYYTQANFNDGTFVSKAKQFYAGVRDYLVSQGWWDQAWSYVVDETEWVADEPLHNGADGFQRFQAWAQLLKEVDAGYRITASSVYPAPVGPPDRGWPDLKGLVDDWNVVVQDADVDPALWASRQALGETLSFYHNDWGDFLDYKATLHRGLGWVAYKHRAWAVTGWAVAAWIGESGEDIVNPWTTAVTPVYGLGGGALFWPGEDIEGDTNKDVAGPLPSIRLKLAREAVEDHDYLSLLAAQTSPDYVRGLARGLIPRDYWDWDPPPEALYGLRDRIGRRLDNGNPVGLATVQGVVTDAGAGVPIAGAFVTDGESGALTDATGRYSLTPAAPASSTAILSISADRYAPATDAVPVAPGSSVVRDVALTRVAEESVLLFSFEGAGELDDWEFANTIAYGRVGDHATHASYALRVEFNDNLAGDEPYAGTWVFPTTDWSSYTALEFDAYNASDYYTHMDVGVADVAGGWYPQTGGTITLLPNQSRHVVIPLDAIAASGVDLTRIEWLDITPETIVEEENYQGQTQRWRAGPRTLYFDNLRLVRVVSD